MWPASYVDYTIFNLSFRSSSSEVAPQVNIVTSICSSSTSSSQLSSLLKRPLARIKLFCLYIDRVLQVICPVAGVGLDVEMDFVPFVIVADNSLIKIALPYGRNVELFVESI